MATYQSYLIRLWRHDDGPRVAWRIVLVEPHSGERFAFSSMAALVLFLEHQPGVAPPPAPA